MDNSLWITKKNKNGKITKNLEKPIKNSFKGKFIKLMMGKIKRENKKNNSLG